MHTSHIIGKHMSRWHHIGPVNPGMPCRNKKKELLAMQMRTLRIIGKHNERTAPYWPCESGNAM